MPDEQAKVVKEIPRDAETIDLFKSLPEPDLYRRVNSAWARCRAHHVGTLTWNFDSSTQ